MRIALASILLIACASALPAQSIITFHARHQLTQDPLVLDSIRVENLTRSRDTLLIGTTRFDADWLTSVATVPEPQPFSLESPYPSIFEATTRFSITNPAERDISISLCSVLGKIVARRMVRLGPGRHSFVFTGSGVPSGLYMLVVSDGTQSTMRKLLKVNGGTAQMGAFLDAGSDPLDRTGGLRKAVSDRYTFTAYAEGFVPALIEDVQPAGGAQFTFDLLPDGSLSVIPATLSQETGAVCRWIARFEGNVKSLRFEWDFGDSGTAIRIDDTTAAHQYAAAGTYDVGVRVFNNGNGNYLLAANGQAVISDPSSVVTVLPRSLQGITGTEYIWTASVTNPPAQPRYEWDFGDGVRRSIRNTNQAAHEYSRAGEFMISVRLYDHASGLLRGGDSISVTIDEAGKIRTGADTEVLRATLSARGGTAAVTTPGTPVTGMTITMPDSAYGTAKDFVVSYAPVISHGMGARFIPLTPVISITNGGGYAADPMSVCIPISLPPDHFAMPFFYDPATGKLEAVPVLSLEQDRICLLTRHFMASPPGLGKTVGKRSAATPVQLIVAAVRRDELSGRIMSEFRPGVDDWEFTNRGSYIAPNGHCAGQVITAMWYHAVQKTELHENPLFGLLDEHPVPAVQVDNPRGYRYSSVVHKEYDLEAWDNARQRYEKAGVGVFPADSLTYLSFAYAMLMTEKPQFVGIWGVNVSSGATYGHAISAFGVDGGTIYVADPNFPGLERTIDLVDSSFVGYTSGINGDALNLVFTSFHFYGWSAFTSFDVVSSRWADVKDRTIGTKGTVGQNAFPQTQMKMLNESHSWVDMPDTAIATTNTLRMGVGCPTCDITIPSIYSFTPFAIYGEDGALIAESDANGLADLPLRTGLQRFGILVKGWPSGSSNAKYIDFRWVYVRYEIPASITYGFLIECDNDGSFGHTALDNYRPMFGKWTSDTYRASEVVSAGRRDLEVRVDTTTMEVLSFTYDLTIDFGGEIMLLHFEGAGLPLISWDANGTHYFAEDENLCNYLSSVTGSGIPMCGNVITRYSCDTTLGYDIFITIKLPPRE